MPAIGASTTGVPIRCGPIDSSGTLGASGSAVVVIPPVSQVEPSDRNRTFRRAVLGVAAQRHNAPIGVTARSAKGSAGHLSTDARLATLAPAPIGQSDPVPRRRDVDPAA